MKRLKGINLKFISSLKEKRMRLIRIRHRFMDLYMDHTRASLSNRHYQRILKYFRKKGDLGRTFKNNQTR